MEEEIHSNEESRDESYRGRARPPRIGSFVTIAAALLMLFGAASRMGNLPDVKALLGLDNYAQERIMLEEARGQAAITLGVKPAPISSQAHNRHVPIDPDPRTPYRGEIDPEAVRSRPNQGSTLRPPVSMSIPDTRPALNDPVPNYREPGSPATIQPVENRQEEYVVGNGDTWNKIALRTLGDGKRWKEIQRANPSAQNGLRVGMKLKIPR